MEISGVSIDGMTIVALGLAMCAFGVQKGVADLSAFIMIVVTGIVVMKMKAALPPEMLMLVAGMIVAGNLFSVKDTAYLTYLVFLACLSASIMVLKLFLPPFIIMRLSISVIFLGVLRLLLF
jgi:hypothetical protein